METETAMPTPRGAQAPPGGCHVVGMGGRTAEAEEGAQLWGE